METIKISFINNFRRYGMIIALIGIMLLFQILTSGTLLTPLNITNIIMQNSYIIILAIGMMLIIITGNIDLSVGSVAAFVGAISAIMMISFDLPILLAVFLCLVLGAVIGAWQGFWIAYVNIPSFIVTLAGMLLFRGLTLVVLDGQTISSYPNNFKSISTGFIPDIIPGSPLNVLTMIVGVLFSIFYVGSEWKRRKDQKSFGLDTGVFTIFLTKVMLLTAVILTLTYILASYAGIPYVLITLFVLVVGYTSVMNNTIYGRHIYTVGGNESAARLSGVKTKKMTFGVFVNMGILAAICGLVFSARLNAATPTAGNLFELDAIAAAFIGGASMKGGVGTVMGAVIGALVMGVLNNGMSLMGIGTDWQQAIKGFVLLAAVAFDIVSKNKGS
ncbi:putative multiple sugar transport system permease protein [Salibacterium salarium]|uniref:multiple monosaccharide ABC transporter permease n=1 Tax=Salibacterium salarium TaxID=284579 RepID=UPI002783770E|nr:multiple monosaccharide ABC transporter permease [Salibacterium salarium]MDQ0300069.1 putative multiple sugar transport system permease protein [Salibacterium salarium]